MEAGKKHDFKYEDVSLDLTKNEQKSPKILAINPKGTIPFLVFNGEVLTESAAILRFLASTVDYLKRFYPTDPI
jgi:glutathione S-transferase